MCRHFKYLNRVVAGLAALSIFVTAESLDASDEDPGQVALLVEALLDQNREPHRWLARIQSLPIDKGAHARISIKLLSSPHAVVIHHAVQTLADNALPAAQTVPAFLSVLADPQAPIAARTRSAVQLAQIAHQDDRCLHVASSIIASKEADPALLAAVLYLIGRLGKNASDLAGTVEEYLDDRRTTTRYLAYVALGEIRYRSVTVADLSPDRESALLNGSFGYSAFCALRQNPTEAQDWIPALIAVARSSHRHSVQVEAIRTLVRIGPHESRTATVLVDFLSHDDAFVSGQAARLLQELDCTKPEVLDALADALPHQDPKVCRTIADAIGSRGPGARRARDSLVKSLESCDGSTSQFTVAAYLTALRKLGPAGSSSCRRVASLLSERCRLFQERPNREVIRLRGYVFATLADIGVPNSAVPAILDVLANAEYTTGASQCGAAARAAGVLGGRGKPLAPYLVSAYRQPMPHNVFSLDRYDTIYPRSEATSTHIEIARALRAMGLRTDPQVRKLLESAGRAIDNVDAQRTGLQVGSE